MIIVEPIAIGDVACKRGSPKSVYDRTGTLVEVPADALAVTYDPSDLSKAPFAVVDLEPETNHIRNNTMQGAVAGSPGTKPSFWGFLDGVDGAVLGITANIVDLPIENGVQCIDIRYQGNASANGSLYIRFEFNEIVAAVAGQKWVAGFFYRMRPSVSLPNSLRSFITERSAVPAHIQQSSGEALPISGQPLTQYEHELTITNANTAFIHSGLTMSFSAGQSYDFTVRIGLPHLCRDKLPRFPIKTGNGAVTRAADVIGAGAGLVYSNVPIAEAAYDPKVTYAKDARVYDPVSYGAFQSLVAGNVGKALGDTSAWSPRGTVNRRAMFDDYNNTQTVMPDEILVVLTPEMVAQGLYLGNLDVHELRISMVDAADGVVYSEVISLIESNSQSSYFNWMFRRIKRRTYFFVLNLPVYANALVTISLRKIGAKAKIGMCAIGPVEEFGPSLLGLSTEGKDFSSTTFNFDGTSKTTIRPYAKRMSCDVVVPNDEITYVQDRLFELRQRALVWVGGPYGSTAVFGRYGSFKNVIEYQMQSKMNLTIEGAV